MTFKQTLALCCFAAGLAGAAQASTPADGGANERYMKAIRLAGASPMPAPAQRQAYLAEALVAARENRASSDPDTALSGLLQEASALTQLGKTQEALALLDGKFPASLSLGMQALFIHHRGVIEYSVDPARGLASMNEAIAMTTDKEFKAHLIMMRDSRLGLPVTTLEGTTTSIP